MSAVNGDDLRAIRRYGRKSTKQVSKAIGVSRSTYVNWEADIGQPKLNQFIRICLYCGLDMKPWVKYIKSVTPSGPAMTPENESKFRNIVPRIISQLRL